MKKRILLVLTLLLVTVFSITGCSNSNNEESKVEDFTPFTVTDMAGREVTFDEPVEKAYASNLIGILFIRTIDIDKLGGYTNKLSDAEKEYISEEYWDLPYLGGWSSANPTANVEELVNADIDVIFVTAIVNDNTKSMAEKIQSQTGIPTVMVSSSLKDIPKAYDIMGEVLGEEERADELGEYASKELAEVEDLVAKVPEDEKVSIYYAEGDVGLETDPSGSMHTQVFDFVGVKNVADISENTSNGLVGQSTVSLEQVMEWNPEYIIRNITYSGSSQANPVEEILNNSDWGSIEAVKNEDVYLTPFLPNNWVDRGPSVNRVLGVKWFANLVYPDYVDYDIREEAKEFFSLFYNIDLTDEQLDEILALSE